MLAAHSTMYYRTQAVGAGDVFLSCSELTFGTTWSKSWREAEHWAPSRRAEKMLTLDPKYTAPWSVYRLSSWSLTAE